MSQEVIRTTEYTTPAPGGGSSVCTGTATTAVCTLSKDCRSTALGQASIQWSAWQDPAHQADWTSASLKVEWTFDPRGGGCDGVVRLRLEYSTNGGSSWTAFSGFPKNATGALQSGTASVSVAVGQNLDNLLVRMFLEVQIDASNYCPGQRPGDPDFCTLSGRGDVDDVYLVGTYDDGPPPDPSRACCKPDGTCQVMTQSACSAAGGTWLSNRTSCSGAPCGTNGCCIRAGGTCESTTQANCAGVGDVWLGPGTSCTVAPDGYDCTTCTDVGVCCKSDGTCVRSSQCWCEHAGGVFRGAGTTCSPTPCGAKRRTVLV